MRLIARTHLVRRITEADREWNAARIAKALDREDSDEAEMIRQEFDRWELERGHTRDQLVCPVCGDGSLTPTSKGTSRPHSRSKPEQDWDAVHQLRKDIQTLEAELDRVLESLKRG